MFDKCRLLNMSMLGPVVEIVSAAVVVVVVVVAVVVACLGEVDP